MGGELSGHMMFKEDYFIDDGLFVTIKVMDLLSKTDKKLSELIVPLKKYANTPEINTKVSSFDIADNIINGLEEKYSDTPPPGIPGLQTSLPLMLTAVDHDRLSLDRLIDLMHHNPRRIFDLPEQDNTHVEIDLTRTTIRNEESFTKVGWTPFDGIEVAGQVSRVVLRGEIVFEGAHVLAAPGSGRLLPTE